MERSKIEQALEQAPGQISRNAKLAEESRVLWEEAKIRLKQDEAKMYLSLQAEHPDFTNGDLNKQVDGQQTIYEQRLAAIMHESQFKKHQIDVNHWENLFVAARKFAEIMLTEMKSLSTTVKERL